MYEVHYLDENSFIIFLRNQKKSQLNAKIFWIPIIVKQKILLKLGLIQT